MFKKNLYTYSFIKTLYDRNRDYLDSFSPLIFSAIPPEVKVSPEKIQKLVEEKYGLKFPTHLIRTVLTRGLRQDILSVETNKPLYNLTADGVKFVSKIENITDVERRINALGADMVAFFADKGLTKSKKEVSELLDVFVDKNLCFLVDLFGTNGNDEKIDISRKDEVLMLDYVNEAMASKPDHYNTLKEIIFGSIIAGLIHVRDTAELTELEQNHFKNARVYLDSNIVFSALGFHTKEIKESTLELLNLIKSVGLELWIFEFTVDEMCGVIKSYGAEEHKFLKGISVDSILSSFKQLGLGLSDVGEMIGNIENMLEGLGIKIDPTPNVSIRNYVSENEQIRGRISAYKSDKPLASINHDLAVIDHIRRFRRHNVRKIEDPKAIFLTSDNALHNVVLRSFSHPDNGTLSEVIIDRLFANILWLKNPSIDLPINLVIASHSRDLLIDKTVWDRFYTVLVKMKEAGEITVDQAASLFYKNQINDVLKSYSKSDADKIDKRLVGEEIEAATKNIESQQINLETEKSILEESLFASEKKVEDGKKFSQKIAEIRQNIKTETKRQAFRYALAAVFLLSTLIAIFEGIIILWLHHLGNSWPTILLGLALGGYVVIKHINWNVCVHISDYVYKKAYGLILRKSEKILQTNASNPDANKA